MQAPLSKVVWSKAVWGKAVWGKAVWGKAVWGPVVALWLMVPAPAAAQHQHPHKKIDKPLSELSSSAGPQRVIIRTQRGTGLHVRRKLQAHGDGVIASHQLVDATTARVHAADIAALANDPNLESVSLDAPVFASGDGNKKEGGSTSPYGSYGDYSTQYTVSVLKQTLGLGNWLPGSSVTVAVIDSGIAPLADFQGRIVAFQDFSSGKDVIRALEFAVANKVTVLGASLIGDGL